MTRKRGATERRVRSEIGRLGAAARHASLTPAERSRIAKLGGKANAARHKALKRMEAELNALKGTK